jgi:dienelactone hydrolase
MMLERFDRIALTTTGGKKFDVYAARTGDKPVLLLHELTGLTPACLDLALRLEQEGIRAFMPVLFGTPGERLGMLAMIGAAFHPATNGFTRDEISPRIALAQATLEHIARSGAQRIGVIGNCMTGNWGIALLSHPHVTAAILSQPSIPFGVTPSHKRALGVSDAEIEAARKSGKPMLAFRFRTDSKVPDARWERLATEFGGQCERHEIDTGVPPWNIKASAHAVLTQEYRPDPGHPAHEAFRAAVGLIAAL